jgi:ADP-ribose pyrophosphatase YjhB (NUDIX family)
MLAAPSAPAPLLVTGASRPGNRPFTREEWLRCADVARPTEHEVLAAVLQIRDGALRVLLWQRALPPDAGRWALPGGRLRDDEDVEASVRRQLAEKVDVREVGHIEQLSVFSRPDRVPGARRVATAFLGLVRSDADPAVPDDTAWHAVAALPGTAFDHAAIVAAAHDRLRAKLSYTNLGFALAPRTFTISALRDLYVAALGHPVSATNLQRVLTRRALLEPTGATAPPGPAGGRPAAVFRFAAEHLLVTDAFAVLRPPGPGSRPSGEGTRSAVP